MLIDNLGSLVFLVPLDCCWVWSPEREIFRWAGNCVRRCGMNILKYSEFFSCEFPCLVIVTTCCLMTAYDRYVHAVHWCSLGIICFYVCLLAFSSLPQTIFDMFLRCIVFQSFWLTRTWDIGWDFFFLRFPLVVCRICCHFFWYRKSLWDWWFKI